MKGLVYKSIMALRNSLESLLYTIKERKTVLLRCSVQETN